MRTDPSLSFQRSKSGWLYHLLVRLSKTYQAYHAHRTILLVVFVDEKGCLEVPDAGGNEFPSEVNESTPVSSRSGAIEYEVEWNEYQNVSEFMGGSPSHLYVSTLYLTVEEEALLFQHFLEELGPWVSPHYVQMTFGFLLTRPGV